MDSQDQTKLIFGLSPRATIINAAILAFLSKLLWCLKYAEQIPYGFDFKNPPADFKLADNVPWYYDIPFMFLSLYMIVKWVDYTFKFKSNDYSWEAIKYRYVYSSLGFFLIQTVGKFIFFTIIFSFK